MSKEAIAIKALEALARLGNGEQYTGNVIARTALFEMTEQPAHTGTYTYGACGVSMRMEQPAPEAKPTPDNWRHHGRLGMPAPEVTPAPDDWRRHARLGKPAPVQGRVAYLHPCDPDDLASTRAATQHMITALRAEGKAYPRTCKKCGLGPCVELARADESQIIRNAKDGYPDGRTPRLLTLQESAKPHLGT